MKVGEDSGAWFLRQVPVDEGCDLATTLRNLSRGAGLTVDAWRGPQVRFYVFTGEWFGEGK